MPVNFNLKRIYSVTIWKYNTILSGTRMQNKWRKTKKGGKIKIKIEQINWFCWYGLTQSNSCFIVHKWFWSDVGLWNIWLPLCLPCCFFFTWDFHVNKCRYYFTGVVLVCIRNISCLIFNILLCGEKMFTVNEWFPRLSHSLSHANESNVIQLRPVDKNIFSISHFFKKSITHWLWLIFKFIINVNDVITSICLNFFQFF